MKKIIMISIVCLGLMVTSCSKSKFNYPMESLYGKWNVTDIRLDSGWIDITVYPFTKFGMQITFYSDGTFYGSGYFGNGSGTYEAEGNIIQTYLNGEEYFRYQVKSLSNTKAELTMFDRSGDAIDIIAVKMY